LAALTNEPFAQSFRDGFCTLFTQLPSTVGGGDTRQLTLSLSREIQLYHKPSNPNSSGFENCKAAIKFIAAV